MTTKFILTSSVIITFLFLTGCGADSDILSNGGTINILDNNINTDDVLTFGGVISGLNSSFTSPKRVYQENALSLKLISNQNDTINIPLLSKNTFLLVIPRKTDYYILKILKNNTTIADLPILFYEYTNYNNLTLFLEILMDSQKKKAITTYYIERGSGINQQYKLMLIERDFIDSTNPLIDFDNLTLSSLNALYNNGILSYYEDKKFSTYNDPNNPFEELVLKKICNSEEYPLNNFIDAPLNDPFLIDKDIIISNLKISNNDLNVRFIKALIGEQKDISSIQISANNGFYISLNFEKYDGNLITPKNFYLNLNISSNKGSIKTEIFMTHGTAYSINGDRNPNITSENGKYYIYYPSISNILNENNTTTVTFTIKALFSDSTELTHIVQKTFIP